MVKRILKKFAMISLVAVLALSTSCGKKPLAVKVDNIGFTEAELKYFVLNEELRLKQMSDLFEQQGQSIWGTSENIEEFKNKYKELAETNIKQILVLYEKAKKENIKLTKEEENEFDKQSLEIIQKIAPQKYLEKCGLTNQEFKDLWLKINLGYKYSQERMKSYGFTEKDVDLLEKSKYDRYDIDLYVMSLKSKDTNLPFSAKKEKEAKVEFDKFRKDIIKNKDNKEEIDKIVEKNKDLIVSQTFTYEESKMSGFDKEIDKVIKSLKENEFSDIIKTNNMFVFVKMNKIDKESGYKEALESAISEKQAIKFKEELDKELKEAKVEFDEKIWDDIVIGDTILSIIPKDKEDKDKTENSSDKDNKEDASNKSDKETDKNTTENKDDAVDKDKKEDNKSKKDN